MSAGICVCACDCVCVTVCFSLCVCVWGGEKNLRFVRSSTKREMLVGLDEAGVGPAWGSMWAAAVHLPADATLTGLTDSKRLTARKREARREEILKTCPYGLGEVTAAEIDAMGLGEARRVVFERALDDLVARGNSPLPTRLIVYGTLFRPWRGVPHECVPRADATVPCVSAASVLAKTTRDAQVLAACDADPDLDDSDESGEDVPSTPLPSA